MIDHLSTDFKKAYPDKLVDLLIKSFLHVRENFYLGKHGPSELNGGKFVETVVRILQHELNNGSYTPIGQPIHNLPKELRKFESKSTKYSDTLRLNIPRILVGIYNIRNKRGVGHLGSINPNLADSTFIISSVNWVMAELYRLHYQCDINEAQSIIDELVERKLRIVYDLEHVTRVLSPKISARNQVLILLYSSHPDQMTSEALIESIEYQNKNRFKNTILSNLHDKRLIEYHDEKCLIMPPGLQYVENKYPNWLDYLNSN